MSVTYANTSSLEGSGEWTSVRYLEDTRMRESPVLSIKNFKICFLALYDDLLVLTMERLLHNELIIFQIGVMFM